MKELIIVGGGGFAQEVLWLATDCQRKIKGVLDDAPESQGQTLMGHPVLGCVADWVNHADCEFIIAIGSPRVRAQVYEKMAQLGKAQFATLVHPNVVMSDSVEIGEGSMVCAGNVLTVEIAIGKHCILNINGTVGHQAVLGDFVTIAPIAAVSGNVTMEDFVEVGTGAALRQGVTLERGSMLGMGGVLTKNIPPFEIFAGNPAKKLKELPAV